MFKKSFLVFIILLIGQTTFAKNITIKIYAPKKITTSTNALKEGDSVTFATADDVYLNDKLYIKKNEKITGVITEMHDNNFICEPATIFIENFQTKDISGNSVNLKSSLYITGHSHYTVMQFLLVIPEIVRGGEVQIKPNEIFTIYMEEKI